MLEGTLRKILDVIIIIHKIILMIAAFSLTGVICLNVFLRYFYNYSFSWILQGTILLLTWIVFSGVAVGYHRSRHIAIDMVEKKIRGKAHKVLFYFSSGIIILFLGVVFYYSIIMGKSNINIDSESLPITMVWFSAALIFSAVTMLISTALKIMAKRNE